MINGGILQVDRKKCGISFLVWLFISKLRWCPEIFVTLSSFILVQFTLRNNYFEFVNDSKYGNKLSYNAAYAGLDDGSLLKLLIPRILNCKVGMNLRQCSKS